MLLLNPILCACILLAGDTYSLYVYTITVMQLLISIARNHVMKNNISSKVWYVLSILEFIKFSFRDEEKFWEILGVSRKIAEKSFASTI